MNVERLNLCADLLSAWADKLDAVAAGGVDLSTTLQLRMNTWRCGTQCCAWGYLASCPEVQAMGVELLNIIDDQFIVTFVGASDFKGIALFFGVDELWALKMFGSQNDDSTSALRAIAVSLREQANVETGA